MSWCDFMAGWMGGCAGLIAGHPFDTVKVRQQAEGSKRLMEVVRETARKEGTKGFFKGMLYPLVTAGAMNSMFFGVYGVTLAKLQDSKRSTRGEMNGGSSTSGQRENDTRSSTSGLGEKDAESSTSGRGNMRDIFLAGSIAGAAQLVIACPVDVVKIKLQTQTVGPVLYRGPWHCVLNIFKTQGPRGLYRGVVPQLYRDSPAFGLYMVLYEGVVEIFGGHARAGKLGQFVAGGVAGVLSWMSILPLDVLKSRMQADSTTSPKYKGLMDCARQSYQESGFRVFTRGCLAMSLRAFPLNGMTFLVYELIMKHCQQRTMST